jgi:nitrile hydratase accessory protein
MSANVAAALRDVPSIPCEAEAPVFEEPWQAQAFAMALTLQQKGVFTWAEWADTLGDEIKNATARGEVDDGSTYYHHWMAALEQLVARKQLTSKDALERHARAWGRAAHRTPHGQPIVLGPEDFD